MVMFLSPSSATCSNKGTDQPDRYMESNVVKRTNPYAIVKEVFKVTGSQATNGSYIDLGGGDYRWYIKGEQDARQRFVDKRGDSVVGQRLQLMVTTLSLVPKDTSLLWRTVCQAA